MADSLDIVRAEIRAGDSALNSAVDNIINELNTLHSKDSTEVLHRSEGDLVIQRILEKYIQDLLDGKAEELNRYLDFQSTQNLGMEDLRTFLLSIQAEITGALANLTTTLTDNLALNDQRFNKVQADLQQYLTILSDVTLDSTQITLDNGELRYGAWTILSQARQWDLDIINRLNGIQNGLDGSLAEAIEELQNSIPSTEEIISKAIEELSNAPGIKELSDILNQSVNDVVQLQRDLAAEAWERAEQARILAEQLRDEAVSRAEDLRSEFLIQSDLMIADIQKETSARIEAINSVIDTVTTQAAEDLARAQQLEADILAEVANRTAALDALAVEVNENIDTLVNDLTTSVNAQFDSVASDMAAMNTSINESKDGLTQEIQYRKDGDAANLNAINTYKVSNDGAIAGIQTSLSANVTKTNANATAISGLTSSLNTTNTELGTVKTSAANAMTKAQTAVDANSALSTRVDALYAAITESEGTVVDVAAFNALKAEVSTINGTVNTLVSDTTALKSNYTDLNDRVSANTTASNALTTRMTAAEGSISAHNSDITLLRSDVNTFSAGLATKASNEAVNALTSDLSIAKGNITNQASDITRLKTSLNSTSALSVWSGTSDTVLGMNVSQPAKVSLVADVSTQSGSYIKVGENSGNDYVSMMADHFVNIDPNKLYRMRMRYRRMLGSSGIYIGLMCANSDKTKGITASNTEIPIASISSALYVLSNAKPANTSWNTVEYYFKGRSVGASTGAGTKASPKTFPALASYTRLMALVGYNAGAGEYDIDYIVFEDAEHVEMNDANASAVQALTATVSDQGGLLSSHTNSLTALNGSINTINNTLTTKADSSALSNYYTKTESNSVIAGNINSFNASLVIGGDNLLPGTKAGGFDPYLTATVTESQGEFRTSTFKFTKTAVNPGGINSTVANRRMVMKAGVTYTLTFKARGTALPSYLYFMGAAASGGNLPITDRVLTGFNEDTFVEMTATAKAVVDTQVAYLLIANTGAASGTWCEIAEVMVQEGTKPTTWSLSPLDLENSINANASAIQTTQADVVTVDGKTTANSNAITTLQGKMTVVEGGLLSKADSSALQALDNRVTSAEGSLTSQSSSITSLNNSLTTTNGNVTAAQNAANAANTLAGGKGKVLFQSAAPAVADRLSQNLWIDTTGGVNTPKRWNGSAWVAVTDKIATDALAAANAANTAITTKADASALSNLDSKVTIIDGKVTSQASSITKLQSDLTATDAKAGTALTNAATAQQTANTAVTATQVNASNIVSLNSEMVIRDQDNLVIPFASTTYTGNAYLQAEATLREPLTLVEGDVYTIKGKVSFEHPNVLASNQGLGIYIGGSPRFGDIALIKQGNDQYFEGVLTVTATNAGLVVNYVRAYLLPSGTAVADTKTTLHWVELRKGDQRAVVDTTKYATTSALQIVDTRVTDVDGKVNSNSNSITSLNSRMTIAEGSLTSKADSSALTALTTRVTNAEGVNTSQGTLLTNLQNSLDTTNTNVSKKADSSALTTLESKVTGIDGRVTSNTSSLTSLQGQVATVENGLSTKADSSALNNYYTKTATDSAIAGQLTTFNSNLVIGGVNQLINSEAERTASPREYMMYENSAHIYQFYEDNLGKDVTISFDLKVPVAGTVKAYCGNGTHHAFNTTVTVTASNVNKWVRYAVTAKPVKKVGNESITTSGLEFYGTYDTGRFPSVRKVQLEAGNKATDWSPSPRDTQAALDANVTAINSTNTNVTNLGTTVTSQGTRISNIENKVNSSVNGLDTKVAQTTFDTLNNKVTNTDTGLEAVNSKTTLLTTNVNYLNKTKDYVVSNYRNGTVLPGSKSRGIHDAEKHLIVHTRGFNLTLINADGTLGSNTAFDLAGGFAAAALAMRTALEALTTTQFFILTGQDHISTFGTNTDANAVECRNLLVTCGVPAALVSKFVINTLPVIVGRKGIAQGAAFIQVLDTTVASQWMDTPVTFVNGRPVGVGGSTGDKLELDVTTKVLEDLSSVVNHSTTGLAVTNSKVVSLESTVNSTVNGLPSKVSTTAFDTIANKVNNTSTGLDAVNSKTTLLETTIGSIRDSDSLLPDYMLANPNAWFSHYGYSMGQYFKTVSEGKVGTTVFRKDATHAKNCWNSSTSYLPNTRKYRISAWIRRSTDATGTYHFTVRLKNAAGVNYNYQNVATITGRIPANGVWTYVDFVADVTATTEATMLSFGFAVGHTGTAGWSEVQGFKVEAVLAPNEFTEPLATAKALDDLTIRVALEESGTTVTTNKITAIESLINDPAKGNNALATGVNDLLTKVNDGSSGLAITSQKLTDLTATYNGMTIGGTNLMMGTKDASCFARYGSYGSITLSDDVTVKTKVVRSTVGTVNMPSGMVGNEGTRPKLIANKQYVLSFLVRGNVYPTYLYMMGATYSGGNMPITAKPVTGFNADTFIKVEVVFTSLRTTQTAYPLIGIAGSSAVSGGWFEVAECMLQEGNTATAWSDSYADVPQIDESKFAEATAFNNLKAYVGVDASGGITTLSESVTSLTSRTGANENSLIVQANVLNGIKSQYHVKMETNGVIGGFGLLQETGAMGTVVTTFGVHADNFFIGAPASNKKPFIVTTSTTTVNGVSYPAGTWIDTALIANATIGTAHIANLAVTNAKIANLAVDNAKIANLSAEKINAGTINAARIGAKSITAAKISVPDLSAISASLGTIKVNTANIEDGAITTAKIGDLQVDTLKIKDRAVTVPLTTTKPALGTVRVGPMGSTLDVTTPDWFDVTLTGFTPNSQVMVYIGGQLTAVSIYGGGTAAGSATVHATINLKVNNVVIREAKATSSNHWDTSATATIGSSAEALSVVLATSDNTGKVVVSASSTHTGGRYHKNWPINAYEYGHSDIIIHILELKK